MTREEAIQILSTRDAHGVLCGYTSGVAEALDMAIESLQERPTGRWLCRESCQVDEDAYDVATCSNCKAEITLEYPCDNYCPNCGTWMHGEVAWK